MIESRGSRDDHSVAADRFSDKITLSLLLLTELPQKTSID
jgi:hypothetical protein